MELGFAKFRGAVRGWLSGWIVGDGWCGDDGLVDGRSWCCCDGGGCVFRM